MCWFEADTVGYKSSGLARDVSFDSENTMYEYESGSVTMLMLGWSVLVNAGLLWLVAYLVGIDDEVGWLFAHQHHRS